jgi:hypothetical protein
MGWAIAACCAAALTGCSMFEPRKADAPPETDDKQPYLPPNRPEGIFVNLKSGVENLAQGANYERTLAEHFQFFPLDQDAVDPSLPPGIFDNWTKQVEMDVLQLMLSESQDAAVTFNRSVLQDGDELVQYRVTYDLTLESRATGVESVYKGVAEFDVRRIGGIWQLEKWRDIERVEEFTTWGYLRGTLREKLGT